MTLCHPNLCLVFVFLDHSTPLQLVEINPSVCKQIELGTFLRCKNFCKLLSCPDQVRIGMLIVTNDQRKLGDNKNACVSQSIGILIIVAIKHNAKLFKKNQSTNLWRDKAGRRRQRSNTSIRVSWSRTDEAVG